MSDEDPVRSLLGRLRRSGDADRRTASSQRRPVRPQHPDDQEWSPAGPGQRDPATLSGTLDEMVASEGWRRTLDEASLAPRWEAIVGSIIAEHTRPDKLVAGELTIEAASTAWATQIRLMSRTLLARIAAEVGEGIVTKIRVRGPTSPDWRHGPLRVRGGKGPRDTYG